MRLIKWLGIAIVVLLEIGPSVSLASAETPLKIGFSDWPGWTGWQIAVDKGWFKDAGVNVEMDWFDYGASLDAFSAGKLDGNFVGTGDSLALGANGAKNVIIMLTDYSNGNDQIVGKPGVTSVKQLAGQKVALEIGLPEHLLLEHALKSNGMAISTVTLVGAKTQETPQILASGAVAAVGVWQPISDQVMMQSPGARPIYTSAQAPGLIFDGLAVTPQSLQARRADWLKVIKVWYRIVDYINNPATHSDAMKIMSARDGVDPATYVHFVKGTRILSIAEAQKAFLKSDDLLSLYGSDKNADDFNVRNGVYKTHQEIDTYIDASLLIGK